MTTRNISDATAAVLSDIEGERLRQVRKEGWTTAHDDSHDGGELAVAAACYAEHAVLGEDLIQECDEDGRGIPPGWPWSADWWKPKDPRRDLVRAAALIVAEIERLDRAEKDRG